MTFTPRNINRHYIWLLLIVLLASCSITKRRYRKGYDIEWGSKRKSPEANNTHNIVKPAVPVKLKKDSAKHWDPGIILTLTTGYPWFFGHPQNAVTQGVNFSTSAGFTYNNWIYDIKFFTNNGVINMPVCSPTEITGSVFYSDAWTFDVGHFLVRTKKVFLCPYVGLGDCMTTYGEPSNGTIQKTSNPFLQPSVSMKADYNFSVLKLEHENIRNSLSAEYLSICLYTSYTPIPFNPGSGLRGSAFSAAILFDFYMGFK